MIEREERANCLLSIWVQLLNLNRIVFVSLFYPVFPDFYYKYDAVKTLLKTFFSVKSNTTTPLPQTLVGIREGARICF